MAKGRSKFQESGLREGKDARLSQGGSLDGERGRDSDENSIYMGNGILKKGEWVFGDEKNP